ncbi:formamidase [Burkholderia lata]|uniref:Formamidase n=1 Tax=Burkholderia lata (strain ATCC 17760 / DSM 23089 / LMG 22485 / NCIMB 9086 / R18194 / 383) TaxID=482957 RepID=A0A6P2V034_BURL3|nr:acetamidase/formamidase family protein [Burkholderia lata]VWC76404.1 formamidase [Burkholderia lata]
MSYRVSRSQVVYAMSKDNIPVLSVPSGSEMVFETCDCFEDQINSKDTRFDSIDWNRINPATGPVFVEGAEPGDTLAVTIHEIKLAEQAVMVTGKGLGVIGDRLERSHIEIVPIRGNKAVLFDRVEVPLNPMIGVIGSAPAGDPISSGVPDAHGGNMDCRVMAEGTTVYLPVNVPGALLALGDLHAAMGDGEVSVCGLEVHGEVRLNAEVVKGRPWPLPMAHTGSHLYTIGSAALLDDAAKIATDNMVDLLTQHTGLTNEQAINLMSVGGHLQICQIVDPKKTCRFEMPLDLLAQLGFSM